MIRVLLLAALTGPTLNLPLPDAKIYFPDEKVPIDPRGGYFQHTDQTGQHTHLTKSSPRKAGYQSHTQWPPAVGESGWSYGGLGHHVSYSSYGQDPNPQHLSYSYGSTGSHQSHPHTFHSQSHTFGGSQSYGSSGGSTEGQIEQISHGNHGSGGGSAKGGNEQTSHENYDTGSVDSSKHKANGWEGTGNHVSHDSPPNGLVETNQYHESNSHYVDESSSPVAESSHGEVENPSAADIAAEEHHIIQEIEQLVGLTNPSDGITKNPITQQQEIIREIKGLKDPQQEEHDRKEDSTAESGLSNVDHKTTIPPVGHYEQGPQEPQEHTKEREESSMAPMVKVTSNHGYQGAGHVTHTEVNGSHRQSSSDTRAKPDPLDLMNIYNDYVQGDFRPGHVEVTPQQPKKELKPEIKQTIENIMRDYEVMPENEGKPQPPPRNYKITKHVKVTTTTHNHPVLVPPSQTITKTVHTHTFQPTSNNRQVITHHINIAELLEQLRKLESSPHHRNITWCEEKIKEFLTELNRKEANGIEINQSVQEETLHHILTQDQTITNEVRHEVEHEANVEVEEQPFVKKTVVELGENEPTRPPSHWTAQEVKSETHATAPGHVQEGGSEDVEEEKNSELPETRYETSEEPQTITVTPNSHRVQQLETLSHQSHTSSANEDRPSSENEGGMEQRGSDSESVAAASLEPKSERPGKAEIEEFRGETEREERPLPPGYKPREEPEEKNEIENETAGVNQPNTDHKGIDDLSIDLPQLPQRESSREEGEEEEHISAENVDRENTDEGPNRQQAEHVIHGLNNGDPSVGQTEYVVESEHQQTGESNGLLGSDTIAGTENSEGQSSGSRTEQDEATVEHTGGHYGHLGGGIHTQYIEETIHHTPGGSHGQSGGGSQTEYVEETIEHHKTAGHKEINYDQLIEELISLESLPGHQAIDKCEEKIRHFLEVLRRQQERGFDQNQAELQRLRLLLQEIQAQKQNQSDSGVNPQSSEANSFWKKIGRKIRKTFEKAKTKAHDTVNGMMNT